MQEIYDQEKHIEALRKGLRDKEAPLKVAQTRLESRGHRPDVELCRDPPHHRLVQEVNELQESIELLNRKLNEAESAHQVGRQTQLAEFRFADKNISVVFNLVLAKTVFVYRTY